MAAHRFDVFVSYSHADSEWVRKTLIPRLTREKLKVCVDYEHFAPGGSIVQAIINAIKESRYTLLVFTDSFLNSVWTRYERDFADYARVTEGRGVIPLILRECQLPDAFPMLVPADFTNEVDREYQMKKLIATMRSQQPAALMPPPEPAALPVYRNFDIELTPSDGERCRLRGGCPDLDAMTTQIVTVPYAELQRDVELVRRGTADRMVCQEVGRRLYGAIFTPDIVQLWNKTAEVSNVDGRRILRLRLRLNDRRLAALPWELLHTESFFMSMARTQPIVRYNGEISMPSRDSAKRRANILVADIAPRKGSRTAPAIRDHLETLKSARKIDRLEVLETASLSALQSELRRGAYDVLHVIAQTEQRDGAHRLMLDDGSGVCLEVDGEMFAYFIRESPIHLLVLSAADSGGKPEVEEALADVAMGANRAGVPAVVVVQGKVGHRATIAFANAFYDVLADGCPIEAGMAEGRKAIVTAEGLDNPKWALPLLFNDEADAIAFGSERPSYCFDPRGGAIPTRTAERRLLTPRPTAAAPPKHNIAADFHQELIGREGSIHQIAEAFAARGASNVVVVKSDPGFGKTAVAREFAWRAVDSGQYDSVTWVSPATLELADPSDVLHGAVHQITADVLAYSALQTVGSAADNAWESPLLKIEPAARLREIAPLFASGRHLMVIDDISAAAEDAVRTFIEAMPRRVHFLVTSVRRLGIGEQEVELGPLSERDMRALVARLAPAHSARALSGNPFVAITEARRAMAGAAPLAQAAAGLSLAEYVRALFDALSEDERRVLAAAVELPFAADRFIVRHAAELDETRFAAAVQRLLGIGLIERRGESLALCSTLRALFRDRDEAALRMLPEVRRASVSALMAFLDRTGSIVGKPDTPEFTRAMARELSNMVWGIRAAFGLGLFEFLRGFRNFLQDSLYALGFWNAAVEIGEMAYFAASRVRDHQEMGWSALYPLARIHYQRGDLRDAERWCITALAIFGSLENRQGEIAARRYLGRIRQSEGNFEAARTLFTQILDDARQRPEAREEIAAALENLAALELAAGDRARAERLYHDALQHHMAGAETISTLHELGRLALLRNDVPTALHHFRRAQELLAGMPREIRYARIEQSIGLAFELQGEYGAARERLRSAHQIFQRLGARTELAEADAALVRVAALHERKTK